MSDEIRVNRPMNVPSMNETREIRRSGGSKLPWIVLVLVIVLGVLGFLFRDKLMGSKVTSTSKPSGYQAVFLTNGQVYFGKLSHEDGDYATLKDIYYLQVTTPPGLQGSTSQTADQTAAQQQLSLVKLGQELHGPVDSMQISRSQILFFEDMKDDGKVMQAIHQYQQNPPAAASNSSATPAANTTPATNTPLK